MVPILRRVVTSSEAREASTSTAMQRLRVVLFSLRSLTFNSETSRAVVLDTVFEPVFWVIDHFVRILGPAFVLLVIGLTTSVVVIWYSFVLPAILLYTTPWIVLHITTAHWLLINIVFHYFKAVFTSPGRAPQDSNSNLENVKSGKYSICKKCIQIKPPRSHHCSICKRCVLKMDHHCPWINNCVGHFNHQHFILFCIFMCLGTLYVTVSARNLFIMHFFHDWSRASINNGKNNSTLLHVSSRVKPAGSYRYKEESASKSEHRCILFVFMLCSSVTLALGILTGWHCRLISYGETSIEWHSNRDDAKRLRKKGLIFSNPYNFGVWNNWKMLLGLVNGRSWLCILLPSTHPPYGDGISWHPLPNDLKKSRQGKLHIV
ncbi:Palmitoyltransferase zdhhc16 [Porites harrisoni]